MGAGVVSIKPIAIFRRFEQGQAQESRVHESSLSSNKYLPLSFTYLVFSFFITINVAIAGEDLFNTASIFPLYITDISLIVQLFIIAYCVIQLPVVKK